MLRLQSRHVLATAWLQCSSDVSTRWIIGEACHGSEVVVRCFSGDWAIRSDWAQCNSGVALQDLSGQMQLTGLGRGLTVKKHECVWHDLGFAHWRKHSDGVDIHGVM